MIELLKNVLHLTTQRMSDQVSFAAPGIIAGLLILVIAYCLAWMARWLLLRIIKGISLDRFLRQSGFGPMLKTSGKVHAAELLANGAFWMILLFGLLTAVSAFDTQLTSRLTEAAVFLIPKLLVAAGIILAGIWFGRYLGHHILVWSVNEGIPSGRRLAAAVRVLVVFVAVAAAADHLDFARNVFLATLILLVGGIVLTASVALGLYGKDLIKHYLEDKHGETGHKDEMPLWRHL